MAGERAEESKRVQRSRGRYLIVEMIEEEERRQQKENIRSE
jgi:hypothetical protein